MTHSRFSAFDDFACSRNGNSLNRRIHAMARHYASSHVAKIDPNWHSIEIHFSNPHGPSSELYKRPLTDKDACHVEFDYRPSEFVLVGPAVGHVNLMERIFQVIPESLFILMRTFDVMKTWFHTLYNPKHVIELIDGKTIIVFENCEQGVVRNVNGNEFDIEYLGMTPSAEKRRVVKHYTRERLLQEMTRESSLGPLDKHFGEPVGVDYFPFLPLEGMTRNTVDEYNETHYAMVKKFEAKQAQREAEQKAQEATRRANLTDEERRAEDEETEAARAQGQIVRALLPLLPTP